MSVTREYGTTCREIGIMADLRDIGRRLDALEAGRRSDNDLPGLFVAEVDEASLREVLELLLAAPEKDYGI